MPYRVIATDPRADNQVVAEALLDTDAEVRNFRRTYSEEYMDVTVDEVPAPE